MNERNVCIGDIISVGSEVVLQVSLPRMPCYKLNHRFSLKEFAPQVYKTSRTGWYYRVLKEGVVKAGDELKLVERKWPQWTVERIQEYLHRDLDNEEMNRQLSEIEVLGEESRGQFQKRVAKAKRKAELAKKKQEEVEEWREFEIISKKKETDDVISLVLKAKVPLSDPEGSALGAHARMKLPNGLVRSYSIVSTGPDGTAIANQFELGIKLEPKSRGGSKWFHEEAKVGSTVQVNKTTSSLKFKSGASSHHLIIGGIGITAFLALIKALRGANYTYVVHYAVQTADQIPFLDRLEPHLEMKNVVVYDKAKGQRMDIDEIVRDLEWNSNLYVCGPPRMMEAAQKAVASSGQLGEGDVHYEAFGADASGDPFEVEVRVVSSSDDSEGEKNKEDDENDGKTSGSDGAATGGSSRKKVIVSVGEEETLLEVLRKDFDIASSCEAGNCGTCKVMVKEGRVEHRGTGLTGEEQEGGYMLSCVSRGIGRIAIEI